MKKMIVFGPVLILLLGGSVEAMAECAVESDGQYMWCGGTNAAGNNCSWVQISKTKDGVPIVGCALSTGRVVSRINASVWKKSEEAKKLQGETKARAK